MTPLALVPDEGPEDPRLTKLRALQEGPETDIEALGNAIMTLEAWAMLSNAERAGSPGDDYIIATAGRLARVRQHLIDAQQESA